MLDTGSQKSYILERTANDLGYSLKKKERLKHCLFGGIQSKEEQHNLYQVQLASPDNKYSCCFDALDQKIIVGEIPHVYNGPWTRELREKNIKISDDGKTKGPIEILIGADVVGKLLTGRINQLKSGLVAVETKLGWTLMGKIPGEKSDNSTVTSIISMYVDEAKISELWDLDVLGIRDPIEVKAKEKQNEEVREHFQKTVSINKDGRYEIKLPWKYDNLQVPSNKSLAEKRLQVTTGKLKMQNIMKDYDKVFSDWEEDRIIEEVKEETKKEKGIHYLPHRPVVKENSTTRIRPVFDASARLKFAPSLNQCLFVGPNMIELIPRILLRFRLKRIGVIADIQKAFLQISVCPSDRDYLRFLWWFDDKQSQIKTLRHARVVFGLTCSPYLLAAVIDHHLNQELKKEINDSARKHIQQLQKSFYVDNCVTSVSNKDELNQFICESRRVMMTASMNLRSWEYSMDNVANEQNSSSVVLGLKWQKQTDTLSVNFNFIKKDFERVTKRLILSTAHKLYDPLGFLAPITVCPKLLLQEMWSTKLGWDEPVPEDVKKVFLSWYEELMYLTVLQIPRWLMSEESNAERQSLHIFCDASKIAYAAVVFLRIEKEDEVVVHFVQAKSRVTPLKPTTIPRVELLAATVGARLAHGIKENIGYKIATTFWSDATTVLAWIQREEPWNVFVKNRVTEIKQLTEPKQWRHIVGSYNPADLPSRGCKARQLLHEKWWEGPKWLKRNPEDWPKSSYIYDENEIAMGKTKSNLTMPNLTNGEVDNWLPTRFSSFEKLLRTVAWVIRFTRHCRHTSIKIKGCLTTSELEEAEKQVVKHRQTYLDRKDMSVCSTYIDKEGILRVETKIVNREDTQNFLHPILLPTKHPIIQSLILYHHEKIAHAGTHILLNSLREKYWISRGRRVVRNILKKCTKCRRYDAKHLKAKIGILPINRTRDALVFEVVGIDLTGPLYLKNSNKCWICIFTCAVYRAVHLELVMSLSTESFLLALRRFIARRGRPHTIYSDNGTNFQGAFNLFEIIDWNEIQKYATIERIYWNFIPPAAPWRGGWWERLIRLLKNLLRRTLGKKSLWYEELLTILVECEAIMNSRPLTYVFDSDSEYKPITPAMFLSEIIETGVPDLENIDATSLNRRIRYRHKLLKDIRQRFRSEYLGLLVQPCENIKEEKLIEVGEVVLVGSDNIKRIDWPLAKVLEVIPGSDGVIRTVRLKTAKGELNRPIQRIYRLEINSIDPKIPSLTPHQISEDKVETEEPLINENSPEDCSQPVRITRSSQK